MRTIILSPIEALGICASTKLTLTLEDQSFENQEHVYVYADQHQEKEELTLEMVQEMRNNWLFGNFPNYMHSNALIGFATIRAFSNDAQSGLRTFKVNSASLFEDPIPMSREEAATLHSKSLAEDTPSFMVRPAHPFLLGKRLIVPLCPDAFKETLYGQPLLIDMTQRMWNLLSDKQGKLLGFNRINLTCNNKMRSFQRNDLCRIIYFMDEHGNKRLYRSSEANGQMVPRQFLQLACQ